MPAPNTTKNGQIVPRKQEDNSLAALVQKMKPEIARALPRHLSAERMTRIALTALRTNAQLAECTPASFLGAVMSASQLGLEINSPLGLAYLVPYKKTATLIVGYQGFLELARRSGLVSAIYAHEVREGDRFKYTLGLNPTLEHEPLDDPTREGKRITHVYAVAKLKDGEPIFVVLSRAQINERRARSASATRGPWVTDERAMTLKTAVRELWRWLPKTAEMANAGTLDEAPELGKPQATTWDPDVAEALSRQGLDVAAEEMVDPETGEVGAVLDTTSQRQPGDD